MSDSNVIPLRRPPFSAVFTVGDEREISRVLADHFRYNGLHPLVYDAGSLYGYQPNGLWRPIRRDEVMKVGESFGDYTVIPTTGKERPLKITANILDGVYRLICARFSKPGFFAKARAGVALLDVFILVTAAGLEPIPHAPEHACRFGYPFTFAETEGPAPMFDGFHEAVFRGDDDIAEKIDALEMFDGAAMTGIAPKYEKWLIRYGSAAGGKSQRRRITESLMPPKSVSALEPGLWHDIYTRSQLAHACLNSVGELPSSKLTESESIQTIISGERVTARNPGEEAFSFEPRAAHCCNANTGRLPKVTPTEALRRRQLIVSFNRTFEGDPSRNVDIANEIIKRELPQIVRRALEGAVRLIRQGGYTLPPSHLVILNKWMPLPTTVEIVEFTDVPNYLATLGKGKTRARDLYDAYREWATTRNTTPVTETTFGRSAKKYAAFGKDRYGVWYGVSVGR